MRVERFVGAVALLVYGVAVFAANWLIHNWGPVVIPGGNHLIPVGFGLLAPSGTLAAGVVFVARDVIQRTIGKRWSLLVIVPGTVLTAAMDIHLALASGTAFLLGELADYFIYTPLQRKHFVRAVLVSELVASVVDSVLFLSIAGIPLVLALPGLLLGKVWIGLIAVPIAYALRRILPSPAMGYVNALP